jgi:hypothetical protein
LEIDTRWHIPDKWKRHQALTAYRRTRRFLPATRLATEASVNQFLNRFRTVFVKPVAGKGGLGVIRIRHRGSRYTLQRLKLIRHFYKRPRLTAYLRRSGGFRRHLVQQGIDLVAVRGRPVDFRVLMLRPGRGWQYMGIVGKMASPGRVVTNFHSGGRSVPFHWVLQQAKGYNRQQSEQLRRRIVQASIEVSRTFQHKFPNARRLGIDWAVDSNGRFWLIEVNTAPGYRLFKAQSMALYRKIDMMTKQIHRNMGKTKRRSR